SVAQIGEQFSRIPPVEGNGHVTHHFLAWCVPAAFGDVDDGEASAWRLRQSLISSLRSVHSRRQFDATPGIYSGAETMRRFDPGRQVDDLALVGLDGAVRRRLVMLVEHRQFPVVGERSPQ